MKNCGKRFHSEVGKFRFLNELIKVVSPKVEPPSPLTPVRSGFIPSLVSSLKPEMVLVLCVEALRSEETPDHPWWKSEATRPFFGDLLLIGQHS